MLYQTLHTFEIFLQCFQPKNKKIILIINENLIMVNYLNTTIIIASLSLPKKKIIQWLNSRKCLIEMWNDLIDNHPIRFVETSKCCCHVTANRPIRLVMTSVSPIINQSDLRLHLDDVVCVIFCQKQLMRSITRSTTFHQNQNNSRNDCNQHNSSQSWANDQSCLCQKKTKKRLK